MDWLCNASFLSHGVILKVVFQVYYPEKIVPYVYFKLAKANLLWK